MITKENLISAYFIDNERQNIEVLTRSDDGTKVVPTIIPFEENNVLFKELTSIITVDKLHEDTYQKKKTEKKDFEDMTKLYLDDSEHLGRLGQTDREEILSEVWGAKKKLIDGKWYVELSEVAEIIGS